MPSYISFFDSIKRSTSHIAPPQFPAPWHYEMGRDMAHFIPKKFRSGKPLAALKNALKLTHYAAMNLGDGALRFWDDVLAKDRCNIVGGVLGEKNWDPA